MAYTLFKTKHWHFIIEQEGLLLSLWMDCSVGTNTCGVDVGREEIFIISSNPNPLIMEEQV